jgi:hypothetical protein
MKQSKAFSLIELSIAILVIGILIAGVTQASNMIYEFRLAAAKNLTKTSGIESIKDMTLWLDATRANSDSSLINSNGKTDISNNDRIKTWSDANPRRSGAALSFTNPASTDITKYNPVYIKDGLNGLPSIKFDGVDNYLAWDTGSFGEIFKDNELTIFLVLMQDIISDTSVRFITMSVAQYSSRINIYSGYQNANALDLAFIGKDGSYITYNPAPKGFSMYNAPILISIRLKTDGSLSAKFNGKSGNPDTSSSKFLSSLDLEKKFSFQISSNLGIVHNPLFYLSEMIVYNSGLKNEEILYVEKYLSKKWGIALK